MAVSNTGRRTRTFPKGIRVRTADKRIRKIAKSVVRGTAETKFRTSNHDEASLPSLSQAFREHTPCRIRGGIKEDERIGNDCSMFGIDVRGYLFNNATSDVMHVRALAFIDKERNGQTTSLDQLLLKNNAPVSHLQSSMASVYAVNKQRYRVLWDTVFTLAPRAQGNGSANTRRFQKWIKAPLKLKFGDETDGSITQNDVKVVFYACEADGDVLVGETVELYSQVIGYYKDF